MARYAVLASLLFVTISHPKGASGRSFAYVPNSGESTVSVIDTSANRVVATVAVGTSPGSVAVSPDGQRVYVGNYSDGTVSVIDTATNQVVATVASVGSPVDVRLNPDGTRLFVLDGTFGAGTLAVLATANLSPIARVAIEDSPAHLAVSPGGDRVYITNAYDLRERRPCLISPTAFCDLTLFVADAGESRVLGQIVLGDDLGAVAVSPDGSRAYVTNKVVDGGVLIGVISVIDTESRSVVDRIPEPAFNITLSPDGQTLYALTAPVAGKQVAVVHLSSKEVVARVAVGQAPMSIAIDGPGVRAYIVNTNDNSVSVIETRSNLVIATIPVGRAPIASGSFVGPELGEATVTPSPPSSPTPTVTESGLGLGCCVLSVGPRCATTTSSREFREKCLPGHVTDFIPGYVCSDTGVCEPPSCPGDCDSDEMVSVSDLVVAIGISLGARPVADCRACDTDNNGSVVIAELIQAVNSALHGCSRP